MPKHLRRPASFESLDLGLVYSVWRSEAIAHVHSLELAATNPIQNLFAPDVEAPSDLGRRKHRTHVWTLALWGERGPLNTSCCVLPRKRKRAPTHGRSHDPDQGAQQQRGRRPMRGAVQTLLLAQEPDGSGWSFSWEADRTLARDSVLVWPPGGHVIPWFLRERGPFHPTSTQSATIGGSRRLKYRSYLIQMASASNDSIGFSVEHDADGTHTAYRLWISPISGHLRDAWPNALNNAGTKSSGLRMAVIRDLGAIDLYSRGHEIVKDRLVPGKDIDENRKIA